MCWSSFGRSGAFVAVGFEFRARSSADGCVRWSRMCGFIGILCFCMGRDFLVVRVLFGCVACHDIRGRLGAFAAVEFESGERIHVD